MTRTIVNPQDLHDPVPFGYNHSVSAPGGEIVFLAGQYASDANGQVSSTDFGEQVERSFANLGIALAAVGLGYDDVVRLGTFIVDHDIEKLHVLGDVLHRIWGDSLPSQTLAGVAGLALPEMQFEVDAIAVRP
jgi:enamine deaminase RidA (YjgF/YER057c/UK114 family)